MSVGSTNGLNTHSIVYAVDCIDLLILTPNIINKRASIFFKDTLCVAYLSDTYLSIDMLCQTKAAWFR